MMQECEHHRKFIKAQENAADKKNKRVNISGNLSIHEIQKTARKLSRKDNVNVIKERKSVKQE